MPVCERNLHRGCLPAKALAIHRGPAAALLDWLQKLIDLTRSKEGPLS